MNLLIATAIYPTAENLAYGSFVRTQAECLRKAGVDVDVMVLNGRFRKLIYPNGVFQLRKRPRRRFWEVPTRFSTVTGPFLFAKCTTMKLSPECENGCQPGVTLSNGWAKETLCLVTWLPSPAGQVSVFSCKWMVAPGVARKGMSCRQAYKKRYRNRIGVRLNRIRG
jgi:hypothetical protein